jgi:hypothetical protein
LSSLCLHILSRFLCWFNKWLICSATANHAPSLRYATTPE